MKILLTVIGSFALSYCLTAFFYTDFNFINWGEKVRFITMFHGFVIAVFGSLFTVWYDAVN